MAAYCEPRFGNAESESSDEESGSMCSSSKPSTLTPREGIDTGYQPFNPEACKEEQTVAEVQFGLQEEDASSQKPDPEADPEAAQPDDGGWQALCGALRTDLDELRRKQERMVRSQEEADKQRRGQLDCVSERVYKVEKEVRELKELQQDAIDKAGAAFEVRKSEAQQDRHSLSKVSQTCDALKQKLSADGETFTRQIETLHRWSQEQQQQFLQLRAWMDQMQVHEFQAREAATSRNQLATQLAELRRELTDLKAQSYLDRTRDATGTPRSVGGGERPATPPLPPSGAGTPRGELQRISLASSATQNPWGGPNPPWRRVSKDVPDEAAAAKASDMEATDGFKSEGSHSRPLGFGSTSLGDSLRPRPVGTAGYSPRLGGEEQQQQQQQQQSQQQSKPQEDGSQQKKGWWPLPGRSSSKGRHEHKEQQQQHKQPFLEIVEVNLYNASPSSKTSGPS